MRVALVLAALVLSAVPSAASGVRPATVTSSAYVFVPPDVSIARGQPLVYVNADAFPHNVTATATGKDNSPLFSSATVGAGGVAEVRGVDRLAPGSYPYFCTLHEFMTGIVTVG